MKKKKNFEEEEEEEGSRERGWPSGGVGGAVIHDGSIVAAGNGLRRGTILLLLCVETLVSVFLPPRLFSFALRCFSSSPSFAPSF
jgi:hypothetical protein